MGKKWYSYFVVTDEGETAGQATAEQAGGPPPRAVDLVTDPPPPPPQTTSPAADLAVVYESAKISSPSHGYTVLKIADMLQSEHIRALPADVRAKSVLVALDAAGVKITEIVEDAVRRDRALDTYERVLQQHVEAHATKTAADNRQLEEEVAQRVAELRARIDANTRQLAELQAELHAWRTRKEQEETLIAETVGYFVSENPITLTPRNPQGKGDANAG